jgi:hypothetical protein
VLVEEARAVRAQARHIRRQAAVRLLPGIELASVTVLDDAGRFRTPARTDPLAVRLDDAQYQADEGPAWMPSAVTVGIARWDDR